jgi:RNA polymerase sigma-70 factor (ECF subfamily)
MDDRPAPVTPDDLLAHAEFLRALARSLLGDEHRAEDVVQDAFLVALSRPRAPRAGLRPWLTGVTKNLARLVVRGETRRRRREIGNGLRPPLPGPEEVAARLEGERRLVRAVSALEEPYRSTVVHRYYEGLPASEIAARSGVPAATVRTRLRRALARLRETLDVPAPADRGPSRLLALGGFVTMKKAIAAAALVLLAGAGIHLALKSPDSPPPTPNDTNLVADHMPATGDTAPTATADAAPSAPGALDPDRDLHGVVRDPTGAPVAGARIETSERPEFATGVIDPMRPFARIEGPSAVSAADGSFAVRLRPGVTVDLRVTAEGRGEAFLLERSAGDEVDVVLEAAARLTVRVATADGAPVAGAKLLVARLGTGLVIDRRGETDAAGECAFPSLAPGPAGVLAAHDLHGIATGDRIDLAAGETRVVDLAMPERPDLRVIVTDAATGRPVPGAVVTDIFPSLRSVRTGEDGRFVLPALGIPPMEYVLVFAPGYRMAAKRPRPGWLDIALEPAVTCEGRVVDANGAPIAGARVSWLAEDGGVVMRGRSLGISGTSGEDGRFRLEGAGGATGSGRLHVTAPGHGRYLGPPPAGDVVLTPPGSISGVVTDRAGKPRPGAGVELRTAGAVRGLPLLCRTTDGGRFTFVDLPGGDYTLSTFVMGETPDRVTVNLPEGADVTGVRLPPPADGTLTVIVSDDAGRPVEGARVYARTRAMPSVLTDADGRATFTGLPGGALGVAIGAERPEHRFEPKEVRDLRADGREVRVTVVNQAAVEGRILDPDGAPFAGARVGARPTGPDAPQKADNADGEGRFRFLYPAGTVVDLEVNGARIDPSTHHPRSRLPFRGERLSVTAPASYVTIETERVDSVGLTVRVLDPDGRPVAGAWVAATAKTLGQQEPTGPDGIAAFPALPPAEHEIRVWSATPGDLPPEALDPEPFTATPGGPEVVARFRRGKLVTGVVVDPEGRPAARLQVSALDGRKPVSFRATDEEGRFALPVPGPGPYRIHAIGDDADGHRLTALVEGVEPGGKPLRITLVRRPTSGPR